VSGSEVAQKVHELSASSLSQQFVEHEAENEKVNALATEIACAFICRQAIRSSSHAAVKIARMSSDLFLKSYRGYVVSTSADDDPVD
jgi:hypothetical protein